MDSLKLHEIPNQEPETLQIISDEELSTTDLRKVERDLHSYEVDIKKLKPDIRIIEVKL